MDVRLARGFNTLFAITLSIAVVACSPARNADLYQQLDGLSAEIDPQDVKSFSDNQTEIAKSLASLAGLPSQPMAGSPEWRQVVDAGLLYVDQECDQYFAALFWFDRYRDSAKEGIALTGAATAAALGIAQAAANAISLTAVAFGLAGSLLDTSSNSVLFAIDPAPLRVAAQRSQAAYRQSIERTSYTNQAAALGAVQGYLALCLPASLETLVNRSVTTAAVEPTGTTATNARPELMVNRDLQGGAIGLLNLNAPIRTDPEVSAEERVSNARGSAEGRLLRLEGRSIQRALCVEDDGVFGNETREAIRQWRIVTRRVTPASTGLDGPLSQLEISTLVGLSSCRGAARYASAYERFQYPDNGAIRDLQAALAQSTGQSVPQTGQFDPATRAAIRALGGPNGEMTYDIRNKLAL
ncbi:MAG: hypothetical protein AAFS03_06425 [Pseudomonadota bacterium]